MQDFEKRKGKKVELKIKKVQNGAILPTRATEGSAGADLYACIKNEVTINPGDLKIIPTGIAIEMDKGFVAYLFARSGLGVKRGVCLSNGVGVIDSDYRGEICVGLCNVSGAPYTVEPNERIAQMVISPVVVPEVKIVGELQKTDRGEGGFGSTGKK